MTASDITSTLIVDKKKLSKDETWELILYCCCDPANKEERWTLDIQEKYEWISGSPKGEDTGKFYRWLVSKGLDKKIEIIRG